MKQPNPGPLHPPRSLPRATVALLLFSALVAASRLEAADQFFAGDGSALSASKWGASAAGPFTSAFTAGNVANFTVVNGTGTGASITVGGFTATENFTLSAIGGTLANQGNGVVNINVAAGKLLDFNSQTFTASATAGYTKDGAGAVALAGGTYGGGFTLTAGSVIARGVNAMGGNTTPGALNINGGAIGASATRDFSGKFSSINVGGNFQLGIPATAFSLASDTASLTFNTNVVLGAANRTITLGANGTYTLAGVISGNTGISLTINKLTAATGVLVFNNTNTLSGGITVTGGTIQTADSRFPFGTGTLTLNGGTWTRAAQNITPARANAYTNPLAVTASSIIQTTTTSTRTVHFDSPVSGTAGTTLYVTNSAASGTNHFRLFAGNFTYDGNIYLGGTGNNNRAFLEAYHTVTDGGDQIFNGTISGGGVVYRNVESTVAGGDTILNGANSYTGGTEIRAGFFGIGNDSAFGTGPVLIGRDPNPLGFFAYNAPRTIANDIICDNSSGSPSTATGSTNLTIKGSFNPLTLTGRMLVHSNIMFFTMSNSALVSFSGVISNAAATTATAQGIVKQGPGSLEFTCSNYYAGNTLINEGALLVNNTNGSGTSTGAVIVAGGILGGNGIISGPVSIQSGGTLSPGVLIGTLTINNTLTVAGTTTIKVDKLSGTNDLVTGITTFSQGGKLIIAPIHATFVPGDSFTFFKANTFTGAFTSVEPAPGAGLAWDTESIRTNGVARVHRRPVATNDTASVQLGQTTTIPIIKLVANDSDADGDPLTITAVSANASLGGGVVTYTAPLTGTSDTIAYTLNDGRGGTNLGTVNITLTSSGGSYNQLAATPISGGDLELSYLGIPGTNYALEVTHDLTPPVSWISVMTNPAAGNGYLLFTNTPSLAPTNDFYRTRYVP